MIANKNNIKILNKRMNKYFAQRKSQKHRLNDANILITFSQNYITI